MSDAFIVDGVRTPIGSLGGSLSEVRADDLGARVIRELMWRNGSLDPAAIADVSFGCANQAGEDNRNVARMAALLAGLPDSIPGITVNRLCSSGLNAVGLAAHAKHVADFQCVAAPRQRQRGDFPQGLAGEQQRRKSGAVHFEARRSLQDQLEPAHFRISRSLK